MFSIRPITSHTPSQRFARKLFVVLGFAALGQFFLAQMESGIPTALGMGLYAISVIFLLKFFPPSADAQKKETCDPWIEGLLFLLVLILTIFLRAYGANHFPSGVFVDRAEVACGALRILNEHWRPFTEALSLHVPELCVYYMAAGWFKLFGTSPNLFPFFDVFLSTTGIILMYVAFRQIMGTFTALLAFFILAVMRGNFIFAHQVYFQSETIFFMGLALAPLLYALRLHKPILAALAGLALGTGLYSYQAFKAVPILIIAIMVFELIYERDQFKKNLEVWITHWLVFLLAASPYLAWVIQNGQLGRREAEVSILGRIQAQHSLLPLLENIRDVLRVFNYKMTGANSHFNFRDHRVLDDITGMLYVLGFFYALRRIKEKSVFIALAGLTVMSLPGIFSAAGDNLGRILGMTPFIACVCAFLITALWKEWKKTNPSPLFNRTALVLTFFLLIGAAFENFYTYFDIQANLTECVTDCSWAESKAGRFIAGLPPNNECFLPTLYYGHPTVVYLTYPHWDKVHLLDIARPPLPSSFPKGAAFCFFTR